MIDERKYSSAVACEVTGVLPVTLRAWRNSYRTRLFSSGEPKNPKAAASFSFLQVCVVAAVHRLTRHGVTARHAIIVAEADLARWMRHIADKPKETVFVAFKASGTGKPEIYIGGNGTTAAEIMKWAGGLATVVDLRAIMEDVHAKLAKIDAKGDSHD